MRYFRAFYETSDDNSNTRILQPIHNEFDDKAFALPYRRNGWSDETHECFCVSLIVKDGSISKKSASKLVDKAISIWKLQNFSRTRIEECTLEGCFNDDIHYFSNCSFDEDSIKRQMNLSSTCSFLARSSFGIKEYIVRQMNSKKQAIEFANETKYGQSLSEEINHIFEPAKTSLKLEDPLESQSSISLPDEVSFAPISYIVEANAQSDADEVISILLGSMLKSKRIGSSHVFSIDVDNYLRWPSHDTDNDFNMYLNHQLMRVIEGNALVVRYGAYENSNGYDITAYRLFTRLLDLIESTESKTQIIFSIPEGKKDLIMRLRKRHNKPMVILSKDAGTDLDKASYQSNLAQLKKLAKTSGRTIDKSLDKLLSKRMRECKKLDLENVFKEWETYYEAKQTFPQYADVIDEAINLDGENTEIGAWDRLNGLIGLDSVKEHIRNIVLRVEMGQHLLERGLPREPFSMHMAFLGSPGTGKTEVARLYAEILKDKGVLSEGRLVTVSGGSGFNVTKAFEAAEGSVLFIDEAYGMIGYENTIAELVAQMENNRTNTVVILAGYEKDMNILLDSNPGFRSRIQTIIKFPDYTPEELRQIFSFMCERQQVVFNDDVENAVRDALERGGKRADQGNARYIRKLFEDAIGAQQVRLAKRIKNGEKKIELEELRTLTIDDIHKAIAENGIKDNDNHSPSKKSGREELESLIGLDEVKKLVSARLDFAKIQQIKRDAGMNAPFIPMHMAFKGNPGTGKTEVARLIGRILHEEGVLSVGDFYECGRQDLVSSVVGGSAPKVANLFQKARGSVIFIDEAYSLIDGAKGGPGDEAINALIDQMEKLRNEVVVIFAGYTKEIDNLFSINPGFKSRVKTQIEFPDYNAEELTLILHHMADKQGYALEAGVDDKIQKMAEKASRNQEFGNARFIRNLLEDALVNQSVRLAKKFEDDSTDLTDETVLNELSTLIPDDFVREPPTSRLPLGFAA